MKYAILFLLLAGCAPTHKNVVSIDSDFQPYVDRFVAQGASQNVDVEIEDLIVQRGVLTAGPGQEEFGLCTTGPTQTPTITINGSDWDRGDKSFHEAVLFHELGHCVLGRGHSEELWSSPDQPLLAGSIMFPSLPDLVFYGNPEVHAHYMAELFHSGEGDNK